MAVYTSFVTKGQKSSKWAHQHLLNFKALSRAVSIRAQLKRYLQRYNVLISSCKDAANPSECLRKCILAGYFPNVAKMQPDGTYRMVKGDIVSFCFPIWTNGRNYTSTQAQSCLIARRNGSCFMKVDRSSVLMLIAVVETSNKTFMRDVTTIEREWLTELA